MIKKDNNPDANEPALCSLSPSQTGIDSDSGTKPRPEKFVTLADKLNPKLMDAIQFDFMTEIQRKSLPITLAGDDIIGAAKTGSGKTLAFLVPLVERLSQEKFTHRDGTGAIIISPTRELAMQTYKVLKSLLTRFSQTYGLIIGGSDKNEEASKLAKGVNIIVATPGRLLDHIKNTKEFKYDKLKVLVLDEADKILDIGFEQDIRAILEHLPTDRQTMLFSATITKNINKLAITALKPNYVHVDGHGESAKDQSITVEGLSQGYIVSESDKRFNVLYTFLKKNRKRKVMVFMSSCDAVRYYHDLLNYIDLPVLALHGKQKQPMRTRTFSQFIKAPAATLICTDVAARGLDIPDVDWIIQYDPPDSIKEYIHRVGRTARGIGKLGSALLFMRPEEVDLLMYFKQAKINMQEFTISDRKIINVQEQLEQLVARNYALNTMSKEAYRAFIRSYNSHSMKKIFNIQSLDLVKVAKSFGLQNPPPVDLPAISHKRKAFSEQSSSGEKKFQRFRK